ncbi:phosphoribosyltransferase [Priestia flexa]|uniref:phosphoribosyltransferase n=1 Tax=Priestia flexa TaxID=86664 RepID=UPI003FCEFDBE
MQYLDLSIKEVRKLSLKLAKEIKTKGYEPDVVIYIKSGGYMIGDEIAKYFNIPSVGVRIFRKGNAVKKKLTNLLGFLPHRLKLILRTLELKSGFHKKESKREIFVDSNNVMYGKRILIVDDSVDTGNTILKMMDFLSKNHPHNYELKVAALNVFSMSKELLETDYFVYQDAVIIYPWSTDSKEYKEFLIEANGHI